MAAVDHGADAVYIGAAQFSARAAAGNSVADIQKLCDYAHFFRAKVYVALNTLLYDHELESARKLIIQLWDAGADALIIQDMGLLEMDLPPIPLFASTQTDNRTPEKVKFLEQCGFQRVILARELDLDKISEIRAATSVDLEAFVHGALCVCYSGQCYMSAAIGGRSANRGECGQPCRLSWNLTNHEGLVLSRDRHLLSLKDMNRSGYLPELVSAGISSFKIEGRLKDLAYVKNITGFYRNKIDSFLEGNPSYTQASSGKILFSFSPDPKKTFNRGYTDYYLNNPEPDLVHSFDTPKSMGEAVGSVKKTGSDWFTLTGNKKLNNGDGLCFIAPDHKLKGFRINKVTPDGRLYPPGRNRPDKIGLVKNTPVFRNHDKKFLKIMGGDTAKRLIGLSMKFYDTQTGIALFGLDEDGIQATIETEIKKEPPRNPEQALTSIEKQLGKLGATDFYLKNLTISAAPLFIPASVLNQLRRNLVEAIGLQRKATYERIKSFISPDTATYPLKVLDFRANIANQKAEEFYRKHGATETEPAFELDTSAQAARVMTTRHCILYSLGQCTMEKQKKSPDWKAPFYLENKKGKFQIVFNCKKCQMQISTKDNS